MVIYTIGHSTHPIDEFTALLSDHDIALCCDIRTIPRSRHNPQFGIDALPRSLAQAGIGYRHLESLGGLRKTTAASVNGGWRNASFRGYADYMQTPEFDAALADLLALAGEATTTIMCAEALPWRCHRSLVADALLVRDVDVEHIMGRGALQPATLTSFARVDGVAINYPAD